MRLIILVFLIYTFKSYTQNDPHFLTNPSLSPEGSAVVFCFEGDIWKADIKDGLATRLTSMQGYETNPRISPDGKFLAFTGRQFGNADIYLLSLEGGEIKQLTYHSGNDDIYSWAWDSKHIYFNSTRDGQVAGYKISVAGETPRRIFGDYFFQYDHNLIEHPTSQEIYFSDTWESSNQAARKRYRGPFNPNIQSYNLQSKKHKVFTTWEGKDFYTTIDRKGNIYFISDQKNGHYNLYELDNGKSKALTEFNTPIKTPQVNANGGKIVFEKEYQLWIYDTRTDKSNKLQISILRNHTLAKEKDFDIKGNITAYDISADGKKIVMASRGELFVSDIEGKFVHQISQPSAERVREVKWMADNKTILFSQTNDGYTNWYSIAADEPQTPKPITSEKRNNRNIVFNGKRTQAVYLSGRDQVKLLNLTSMENKTIATAEIWGFQNPDPGFSPNDEYVLFTARKNFEQDILAYHIKENKLINLTNTDVTETNPLWSKDGNHIYFSSQRLKALYPFGMPNAKVYRMPLEKIDAPYKSDKYAELFKETKKDSTKKSSSDSIKPITIDLNYIMERLEEISPSTGGQSLQYVYQKGDKTTVLYSSNHGEGKSALWKTVIEPFEQNKTEKIAGTDNFFSFDIIEVSDKLYSLNGGTIYKLNLDGNKVDAINISHKFNRNLSEEFNQMYYEAWAQMEENYYDEKFHDLDWAKTKEMYAKYLPHLNTRSDLRTLLNDMLGELNSSHQGFGTFGDDETISLRNTTMETGVVFENNEPYKVKRIIPRSAADKKGIDIQPGDILIAVNNETINTNRDRNFYFTKPSSDQEIHLRFTRIGQTINNKLHPQISIFDNAYDEWVDANQKRVDEKSNNKIAYGYMKNMGSDEYESFVIDMTQELNKKEALILDLRYNTGGNVHDLVLQFLSQRSYLNWKYRQGGLSPQPNFAPADKPIVLLTNEQSLSDAEMTTEGFKALKLGKVIGNETYRWIIFTSGIGLVDGSNVRMPAWGCYGLDGRDLEKTGVKPDILVINSFDDKLNGRDPQIDRAITELMKMMK